MAETGPRWPLSLLCAKYIDVTQSEIQPEFTTASLILSNSNANSLALRRCFIRWVRLDAEKDSRMTPGK